MANTREVDRQRAVEHQLKQAGYMQRLAKRKRGGQDPAAGDVVMIPVSNVDRCKLDQRGVPALVVEVTHGNMLRCATKDGILERCLDRSHVQFDSNLTPTDVGLSGVLERWQGGDITARLSVRTASTNNSKFGGQGMLKCGCVKGNCRTSACRCFRAGRECNSRCHPKSANCQNQAL